MIVLLTVLATLIGVGITAQIDTCCNPECVNGWCNDGTCRCDALNNIVWEGEACDVRREPATCPDLPCENGSEPSFNCFRCYGPNGITCPDGWCGILCETATATCEQACINGVCAAGCPSDTAQCGCFGGWTGATCEELIRVCDPPCVNGFCVEFWGVESCGCDPGWSGTLCDEPICCEPDCVNGQCRGLDFCDCDFEWEGPLCDVFQRLRADTELQLCGGGFESDGDTVLGGGNDLLSQLAQGVTPLGVAGAAVSAVWNAQRAQSGVEAAVGIQEVNTFAGSMLTDHLTVIRLSAGDDRDFRLKLDFSLVGEVTASAVGWRDKVARAEVNFEFGFEASSVSRMFGVRHEWKNCSKVEPCVPGSLCEVCEDGSFKFFDGDVSHVGGFDVRLCRAEFEPSGDWLCSIEDTLVSGADASPGTAFSIRANVPYDQRFEMFYSIFTSATLVCEDADCSGPGPGCPLSLCAQNSPNANEPCRSSADCNGGTCVPPLLLCDAQSSNAGVPCVDFADCNGGTCSRAFLPIEPASVRSDITLQLLRVSVVEAVVIEGNLVWLEVPATIESEGGFNYLDPGASIVSPGLLDSPDLDGDGDTDLDDFSVLLGFFGGPGDSTPPPGVDPSDLFLADQDGDNDIDLHDLALLFAAFGN